MIVAIVPAAGKSERMGRPKLLLPLGSRLVLEHVLFALAESVDRTYVVTPPDSDAILALARRFEKVDVVQLRQQTPDMRSSILAGLAHIESAETSARPEAFLIALADQPTITPDIVCTLIERFRNDRPSIVIPTHNGRDGHPLLLAWSMLEQLRAIPADRGLNYLLSLDGQRIARVSVDDHEPLCDLDTPADYERLQRSWVE
jgi:molybdenum cofactor cytidylyltransferase